MAATTPRIWIHSSLLPGARQCGCGRSVKSISSARWRWRPRRCIRVTLLSEKLVRVRQRSDAECKTLYRAIKEKSKVRPKEVTAEMWSVRKQLKIANGVLVFDDDGTSRWIIPHSLRLRALSLAHSNHRGVEGTLARLRRTAYWPNSRDEVTQFTRKCRICSLVKPKFVPATLTPFIVIAPMKIVAMDYVGPLPTAQCGSCYLLVMIDLHSRFPEVYRCSNLSTDTLFEIWIPRCSA